MGGYEDYTHLGLVKFEVDSKSCRGYLICPYIWLWMIAHFTNDPILRDWDFNYIQEMQHMEDTSLPPGLQYWQHFEHFVACIQVLKSEIFDNNEWITLEKLYNGARHSFGDTGIHNQHLHPEDIWNGDETGLFWKMEPSCVLASYDDFQDGTANALADYTIYNALINAADAFINDEDEEKDLEILLEKLPNGDDLSANEYINIEDENIWMSLTDENIIKMVNQEGEESSKEENELVEKIKIISNTVARESVDIFLKYLYQQEPEFGEVDDEIRVLRRLNRRIGLAIQKNLKQPASTTTLRIK
nr:7039_t:CDS:2 [Entrophospora candida]